MYNLIFIIIILKIIFSQNNKSFDLFNNSYNISNFDLHSKNDIINTKRNLVSNPQPIRIYIDTDYLANSGFTPEDLEIYKYALNRAKKALEDLIEIDREYIDFSTKLNSLFSTNIYEGFNKVFMNYNLINGDFNPEADLLILVRIPGGSEYSEINTCKEKSGIISTNAKGRPIIGYIVINIYLEIENINDDRYKKELYSTMFLHQLTHILGFSKTILNGKVTFQSSSITRMSKNKPIIKTLISHTTLINEAKKYFGLNANENLDGLELEEFQDDICNDYIHWDSRILLGDYMTFMIYEEEQTISELTLTLLELTTFYKTNKYTGGLSRFGRNQGLDFFTEDCNELLTEGATNNTKRKSKFPNEFCASITKTTCSSGRLSKGICDNYISDVTPYKYYSRDQWETYGDKYADFCPISKSEIQQSNQKYSLIGNCKFGVRDNYGHYAFYYWQTHKVDYNYTIFNESYGESFSNISFCAFSSVIGAYDSQIKKNVYEGFVRPTCYEMYCSDKSLTIKIDKLYHVCPRKGGIIKIEGDYEGHLVCPHYNLICSQTVPCNNLFDCIDKKSKLKDNIRNDYLISEDASMQIVSTPIQGTFAKAYEQSENGKCPKHCSECNEFKQCLICDSTNGKFYVGTREKDLNPIICNNTNPKEAGDPYYMKKISDKTYFFKCIDHCIECDEANKCKACAPEFNISKNNDSCSNRIIGCKDYNESSSFNDSLNNNGYKGYKFCEKCNETGGYYCLNEDKQLCVKINDDILSYYNNTIGCLVKCENKYINCYSCNSIRCTKCKAGYYLNNNGDCLVGIPHCVDHDRNTNPAECIKCEDNYSCLNGNRKICEKINDVDLYYYVDDNRDNNDCRALCSVRYGEKCKNCTKDKCLNCYDGYFVYNLDKCILSIKNCKEHYYDGIEKYCKECEEHYFCVDNKKDECQNIEQSQINYYIKIDGSNEPICYQKCFKKFPFCLTCQDSGCIDCEANTEKTNDGKCIPNFVYHSCSIKISEEADGINEIDLTEFPMKFVGNANQNSHFIDHYINKDYTITVFIHSECTEDLLNQGYYKIDSKELQNSITSNEDDIIYTVFIAHNFKSHMRYYDNELNYLDVPVETTSKIEYTITNKYIRNVNEALGPLVASLVESEKINIFGRDSDVYNNYCQNITILGIDIPLKQRLLSLYPHSFSEQIACLGKDCVIDEFNFDESTCTCKCKMGNSFDDILVETEFTHFEGPFEEYNNFIETIGIIKCTKNGFNNKNMMANAGFFLIIIGIILQIILYLYYCICGEPITNIYKGTSNPPKKTIMLYSDWDKRLNKNSQPEGEVFIQPRDDADEQLLEEEKTYSNDDDFNTSNISLDTNVGVITKKNGEKGKLSEKPDKRVLILLKNKGGKSQKSKKELEDLKSDNEIINLNEEVDIDKISFCQIYWSVVSLKQHIINYFSCMHCCKITKSYIPLSMRLIRSIFLIFLSFVFNILFLNQGYYEKKFIHFNEKYKLIHAESPDLVVKSGEKIGYAISHTFANAIVSLILLIIVNFIVGIIFFSIRNNVVEIIKNNKISDIDDLASKVKRMNMIFIIIDLILMAIFLMTIVAFVGAYGGGFIDYFIGGIISLILFEFIPFLWSLVIALFMYLGLKNKNQCFSSFSKFFMF